MTDSAPPSPDKIAEDASFAEAAAWLARLRDYQTGSGINDDVTTGFQDWLEADPRNAGAFAEAERLWGRLELPVRRLAGQATCSRSKTNGRLPLYRFAVAASLIALITGMVCWRDDISVRLQSDFATTVGGKSSIDLTDGSHITLNTDSAVAVDMGGAQRQVRLLKGEAWFDVAHDPNQPFIVTTNKGTIRVTGTRFNVRITQDTTEVSLAEGGVNVRSSAPTNNAVTLAPGEAAHLTENGVSTPVVFDQTAVTAWLRGQFVFYDTSLSHVIDEINRYRTGQVVIARPDLKNLKVSGVFRTDDPDAALAVVTDTLGLSAIRVTDLLVVLH